MTGPVDADDVDADDVDGDGEGGGGGGGQDASTGPETSLLPIENSSAFAQ